jgi:uncharacterized membrane protein YebE (DUF533 family)
MTLPFIPLTFLRPSLYNASINNPKELPMATPIDPNDLVTFKELLLANAIQMDTAVQLMIEKGYFTEAEYFTKLKQVQAAYQSKQNLVD